MKLNIKLESPIVLRSNTPKYTAQCSTAYNSFNEYKPHNFSESNNILKASKNLRSIHRSLFSAKPKSIRSRYISVDRSNDSLNFDKTSEGFSSNAIIEANFSSAAIATQTEVKEPAIKVIDFNIHSKKPRKNVRIKMNTFPNWNSQKYQEFLGQIEKRHSIRNSLIEKSLLRKDFKEMPCMRIKH